MSRLKITKHNAVTNETVTRDMTDDEYAALIESGWTLEPPEPTDETPSPDA